MVVVQAVDLPFPSIRIARLAGCALTQQREHDLVLVGGVVTQVLTQLGPRSSERVDSVRVREVGSA
jgi:hypothetical protein